VLEGDQPDTEVVLTGVPAPLVAALDARTQGSLRGVGDRIELRIESKRVGALLQEALAGGAQVISVTPRRASLESLFLTAVEQGRARK
jgi:hypothetical protein